jgi:soluble lytic murein transglycosylase-like protein
MFAGLITGLMISSQCNAPLWLNHEVLDAIRFVESGNRNDVISPKGAKGPYQFMDLTWKEWGINRCHFKYEDVYDPEKSRYACQVYLTWIYRTVKRWGGNPSLDNCLSAYNGGIGRLRQNNFNWMFMPKESVQYVKKIKAELYD